jgi:hypothetical protein
MNIYFSIYLIVVGLLILGLPIAIAIFFDEDIDMEVSLVLFTIAVFWPITSVVAALVGVIYGIATLANKIRVRV